MDFLGFQGTFENIEKLSEIVSKNELSELTIKDGDVEITIKGKKCPPPPAPMGMPMATMPMATMPMPAMTADAPTANQPASTPAVSGNQVKAPIVGTYYAAPSPDSKPFVTVGQSVKKGDVIFIIESMKVMSEVQSEFDGVVKKILVNNGEAVEFDQTLMIIE